MPHQWLHLLQENLLVEQNPLQFGYILFSQARISAVVGYFLYSGACKSGPNSNAGILSLKKPIYDTSEGFLFAKIPKVSKRSFLSN